MSTFISADDYKPFIKDRNLQQMLDGESIALDQAEDTAITTVKDALFQWYNTDAIFSTTGDARPKQVIRWVVCLSLYYLYERLPAAVMPDRIKNNYDEVMRWLLDIEDGKKPVDLPHKQSADGTGTLQDKTKFRWGNGIKPRSHEF